MGTGMSLGLYLVGLTLLQRLLLGISAPYYLTIYPA
jgi:hypothetical protein